MSDLLETPAPRTGELLGGRYRLIGLLGQGGMARVYRARDELLGRDVAVKLFNAGAAEPADQARRLSETRLLAALSHRSLVTLFDAHVDGSDHAYLVMELIDGPTLRGRIDSEGAVDSRTVAMMAADLAGALDVVHAAGVVHRDIKPSNVLLRPSAPTDPAPFRATLTDFGIAYLVDSTRVTTPGTLMGTAAYLAPEQVRGDSPVPASDIYTLGLLLLESLTGTRPFGQGTMHETLLARLARQPEIPGSVGYQWKSLLTAMTAFDPDARPTAAEVARRATAMVSVVGGPEASGSGAAGTEDGDPTLVGADAPTAATVVLPAEGDESDEVAAATVATVLFDVLDPTAPLQEPDAPGAPGASAASGAAASDQPRVRPRAERSARSRRTIRIWILAALALIVLIVITGAAILLLGASAAPAPAPQLPAVQEPLGGHLQQLLESVTP